MVALQYLLAAVVALPLCSAAPTTSSHVSHEQRRSQDRLWTRSNRVDSSAVLPMRIALTQSNLEKGPELLMEVSHPSSPKYGQYWSTSEVHDLFAPAEEAVKSVKGWIASFGIEPSRIAHSDSKGWLAFDASASEVEAMFDTQFYEYSLGDTGKVRIGCDEYSVPEHLLPHIDFIKPGVKMMPVVKRNVPNPAHKKRFSRGPKKPDGRVSIKENPFANDYPLGYKSAAAEALPDDLQGCGQNITPPCYRALYDIPIPTGAVPGLGVGLYEQGDYFAKEDLDESYAAYAPWVPQGTYPIPALIDGAQYDFPQNATDWVGGEANLDIFIAQSLTYPQNVTLYQVDDQIYEPEEVATTNLFNTFLDALDGSYCNYSAYGETGDNPDIDAVYPNPDPAGYQGERQCGVYEPTTVISISYGQAEVDLPANYTKRQCDEFLKLGLQGVSIFVSSGDYGVASFPGDGSENGCLGPDSTIFNSQYPNGCPYLTSVGGTMIYPDQTVLDPESVMQVALSSAPNFSSAGGFSIYFEPADYQKSAVQLYFDQHDPGYPYFEEFDPDFDAVEGLYNRLGRGSPDVSANGANLKVYTNGNDYHFFGTSLSSPVFASVIALINEERANAGKGTVGFVNPVLYENPDVLNDITNGTNLGCGSNGFQAVSGWDPVTGLGTPNYPKMRDLWLSLP
ncbi:putative Peptidase S53 domain-containing protein [Seiridium cardinale]|uniref:Peptidase S53 domain-containing protein n=1 Tax=Seiridium cardinale TaxID=138064 RepID=A0ABR2XSC9_9PEZI